MQAPRRSRWLSIRDALFLDIPYIVDSFVRHADYGVHRLHDYDVGPGGGSEPVARRFVVLPAFMLFALVLVFAAYGPTLSSLCSVFGHWAVEGMRDLFGWTCILGTGVLYARVAVDLEHRIAKRFMKQRVDPGDRLRLSAAMVVLLFVAIGFLLPVALFGASLLDRTAFDACRPGLSPMSMLQLVLLVVAVGGVALWAQRAGTTRARIAVQVGMLAAMTVLMWYLPGSADATEASQRPYRNVFAVIALAMAATALLASFLVRIPFYSVTDSTMFRDALPERELFDESRADPPLSAQRIFGGAVIGILQKPLQFLLLPAFAIILAPTGFIWHACIAGVFASVMLLIASNLTRRWDRLSAYLRRYFLLGTPLITSMAVIVIAILRLADVQYVATILNVAPFGVPFIWMVMLFVLSWWFELQVNAVLATRLMDVFVDGAPALARVVPYEPGAGFPPGKVEPTHRYLLAHPLGQFMVVGWFRDNDTQQPTRAFTTYGLVELFDKLAEGRNPEAAHDIDRRTQLYFALVNLVLVAAAGLFWWHFGHDDRRNTVAPVVTARFGEGAHNIELMSLLRADGNSSGPAIVVAASGGGTRAALYTAVALRGLHDIEADRNIVLLSGVSGGAAAAAYFFGHRDALVDGSAMPCASVDPPTKDPWRCFIERMADPFIRDVLQGAGEWRIQSKEPLGVLLAESFSRRLFADGKQRLGSEQRLGLILNTTVTGHPVEDSPMLDGSLAFAAPRTGGNCADARPPVAALAGGRLAFSNLRVSGDAPGFRLTSEDAPNVQFPFVIVRDDAVELARAAALSANFPPVFPNARVNIDGYPPSPNGCTVRSYYVTDGGAAENLGLVSALLALENALRDAGKAKLRDIRIVMIEGSAFDYDYSQDRGVGAAAGQSKERLTGRLTLELLDRVAQAAKAVDADAKVTLHDLSLPRVFRSRGGFGTNWMFPEDVRVTTPLSVALPGPWRQRRGQYLGNTRYWVTLDKRQLIALWEALFAPKGEFCAEQWSNDRYRDLTTVSGWICGRGEAGTAMLSPDATTKTWPSFRKVATTPSH
ncbi:MAG: patatin-like phospholipase family protein [Casimicrobiaceae bacterium]